MKNLFGRSRLGLLPAVTLVLFAGSRGNDLFRYYDAETLCGETYKTYMLKKTLECASFCDLDPYCRGFSLGPVGSDGKRACELAHYITLSYDPDYLCYLNYTSYVISQGEDRGTRGMFAIGFVDAIDSHLSDYVYKSTYLPEWRPPTVDSVIYADGEKCPDPDQVMVKIDYDRTDGKEQRLLCSAIVPPKSLTNDCFTITIGEGTRPVFSSTNNSGYLSWLYCPYGVLVEVYWYSDPSAPLTPYRYTGGKCCDMLTL